MTEPLRIVIIAGPNGAGKTTLAREFLPNEAHCPDFINADLIAAGLSPFDPEAAALRAGRLMLREIAKRIAGKRSFALRPRSVGSATPGRSRCGGSAAISSSWFSSRCPTPPWRWLEWRAGGARRTFDSGGGDPAPFRRRLAQLSVALQADRQRLDPVRQFRLNAFAT